jgi:hypothetical protein
MPGVTQTIPSNVTQRLTVVGTVETAPRCTSSGFPRTAVWAGGAFGTAVYDTTIAPRIGTHPLLVRDLPARMYYLSLVNRACSWDEMWEVTKLLRNGIKPFAYRNP